MANPMIFLMYVYRGVTEGVKSQTVLSDKLVEIPDPYRELSTDGFNDCKHKYTEVVSAMKISIPNIVIKVRTANKENIL